MTEDSMPESLPTGILPDGATNLEDVLVAGNAEVPTISESNPKSGVAPAPVAVSDEAAPSWFRGIAEAVGWWFGTLLVHVLAGAFMAIGLIVFNILNGKAKPADIMNSESMLLITAGEMILFVLASILAVSVRYWGRTFRELNFSRPQSRHLWMVIGGTLPLTICVSACSVPVQLGWDALISAIPALKSFDGLNTMEVVKNMAESTSLPVMIFVIALMPAIGEELIFRGAIGRVLISNLGLVGGVLLTSFLFGWLHIHPVHAISVMPLGLAMHVVYLWSRSFWLPMLLHFLNNCWASIAAQSGTVDPVREGVQIGWMDGVNLGVSAVGVIALGIVFWQSRVRLLDADGRDCGNARYPVRVCTDEGIRTESSPVPSLYWRLSVVCMVLCHLIVAIDLFR